MTSSSTPHVLASVKQSSERGDTSSHVADKQQAQQQHQYPQHQPRWTTNIENSPPTTESRAPWIPPTFSTDIHPPRDPHYHQDYHQGFQQPSTIATSSTAAQSLPPPPFNPTKYTPGQARAPTPGKSKTPTPSREPPAGKRPPGRPRKHPVVPDAPSFAITRVDNDGHTNAAIIPRHTAPFDFGLAESSSSSGSRARIGASIPREPSIVAPTPSHSSRDFDNARFFAGTRSAYPPQPPPASLSANPFASRSSTGPFTPWGSSGLPYGSPGVPIPPTPYQILPTPTTLLSRQNPASSSVEADGYFIIRNAIPSALFQGVIELIEQGLPVMVEQETERTYVTPMQALRVRDEFMSVSVFNALPITPIMIPN